MATVPVQETIPGETVTIQQTMAVTPGETSMETCTTTSGEHSLKRRDHRPFTYFILIFCGILMLTGVLLLASGYAIEVHNTFKGYRNATCIAVNGTLADRNCWSWTEDCIGIMTVKVSLDNATSWFTKYNISTTGVGWLKHDMVAKHYYENRTCWYSAENNRIIVYDLILPKSSFLIAGLVLILGAVFFLGCCSCCYCVGPDNFCPRELPMW